MKYIEQNAQTQANIKKAFISLINEKGFSNLTVSDITRTAGISRGTFYVHFTDKFALLEHLENTIHQSIAAAIQSNIDYAIDNTPNNKAEELFNTFTFNAALDYADSERETIRALISEKGDAQFFNQIKDLVDDMISSKLIASNGHYSDIIPIDYTKQIAIYSILNIIRHWLNKEHPESPAEIATILMRSRFLAPHDLLVFDDGQA